MMKRLLTTLVAMATLMPLSAQNAPTGQMEALDRGLVALPGANNTGNFVSWRKLGTDDEATTSFDLYNGDELIASDIFVTNFQHNTGTKNASYRVVTKVDGIATETSPEVKPWPGVCLTLKLQRPASGITKPYTTTVNKETVSFPNGQVYSYTPNDMSVGDVDGDGQMELFVKWDPTNAKDNSHNGVTGIVYIDCYKFVSDGSVPEAQLLWRIDLGRNIRAGAHYTQFLVYDFDNDGKAELMCKTGPGTKDGLQQYVSQAATDDAIRSVDDSKDWTSEGAGRVVGGQEWLTVFNGETGAAEHTVFYNPNRNMGYGGAADGSVNWGVGKNDTGSYGNRGERFLAAVAWLDGPLGRPSAVFCRGYYDYAFLWAVDYYDGRLHQKWLSSNKSGTEYTVTTYDEAGKGTTKKHTGMTPTSGSGSGTMYQNGNHNLSVADVDGDGCDEIVWGSACCNNDGTVLYGTGFGHGDAIHIGDHCPDRPGLEVFQIHEGNGYGWDLHDARTGEIIHSDTGNNDNGRGLCANIDANVRGSLFWSGNDKQARSAVTGEVYSTKYGSMNFRIFWDGDIQSELLDGPTITKWNGNGTSELLLNGKSLSEYNYSHSCNGTKNTPNLQADILGDWREEVIFWNGQDSTTLNVFTTNIPTKYVMPTLLHEHTYRLSVAWQNTAYNQPTQVGCYLPDRFTPQLIALDGSSMEQDIELGDSIIPICLRFLNATTPSIISTAPDGTRKTLSMPLTGFERYQRNATSQTILIKGKPAMEGDYVFDFKMTGLDGTTVVHDTAIVHVLPSSIVTETSLKKNAGTIRTHDIFGRKTNRNAQHKGVVIETVTTGNGTFTRKVVK